MAGWFDPGHDAAPTAAQVASLKDLLTKLTKQFNIPADHIDPHRKYMPKSCYGYNLADDWARNLLKDSAPANFIIKASNGYGIGKVAPKPEVLQQYADEAGVEIPKNPDNTINWAEVDKRARKVV
jgi:N-acetyl-anhydromuramyl-L-alanine amidase AmpD